MKRGFTLALAAIAAATLALGGAVAQQRAIAIGTGGTGGVYYPIGGALANLISKTFPNMQATGSTPPAKGSSVPPWPTRPLMHLMASTSSKAQRCRCAH